MIGLDQYPAYCNMILNSQVDLMLECLETDKPYPIRMGFYMGDNALSNCAMEPKRWHDALIRALEFCIGIDTFMNASIQATCDHVPPHRDGCRARGHGLYPLCTLHGDGWLHA